MIIPHSQNFDFAAGNETRQKTARLTPPFGGHLNHDDELYQFVAQTLARFQQTCPDDSMMCMGTMIDMLNELRLLGYTHRQISRAVRRQKRSKVSPLVMVARSALKELARRERA